MVVAAGAARTASASSSKAGTVIKGHTTRILLGLFARLGGPAPPVTGRPAGATPRSRQPSAPPLPPPLIPKPRQKTDTSHHEWCKLLPPPRYP